MALCWESWSVNVRAAASSRVGGGGGRKLASSSRGRAHFSEYEDIVGCKCKKARPTKGKCFVLCFCCILYFVLLMTLASFRGRERVVSIRETSRAFRLLFRRDEVQCSAATTLPRPPTPLPGAPVACVLRCGVGADSGGGGATRTVSRGDGPVAHTVTNGSRRASDAVGR